MFKTFEIFGERTSLFRILVVVSILPIVVLLDVLLWLANDYVYLHEKCGESLENFIGNFEE